MHRFTRGELNRSEKLLIDSLRDPAEAKRRLVAARCDVIIASDLHQSRLAQICALTIATTLSRSHHGGVTFVMQNDSELLIRGKDGNSIRAELITAGAKVANCLSGAPIIAIGHADAPADAIGVRLLVDGGRCGCVPLSTKAPFDQDGFAPSAVLAASLASLEIFRLNALCETDAGADPKIVQLVPHGSLQALRSLEDALPNRLWFIGVGHLGQAAIFGATMCGSANEPREYKLQDHDDAILANQSTQVLLDFSDEGILKILACQRWLLERGIDVKLEPNAFDEGTVLDPDFEVAIAGLDRPEPRRFLENPGTKLVVDAGIGGLASTFASFRIHVFPGPARADSVFARTSAISDAAHREALADFYAAQVDERAGHEHVCGARDVAGVSVGVPFIGTAVAAIILAEIMTRRSGLDGYWKLGGDLRQSSPLGFRLRA